jgi:hypothetical protein
MNAIPIPIQPQDIRVDVLAGFRPISNSKMYLASFVTWYWRVTRCISHTSSRETILESLDDGLEDPSLHELEQENFRLIIASTIGPTYGELDSVYGRRIIIPGMECYIGTTYPNRHREVTRITRYGKIIDGHPSSQTAS